MPPAAQKLLEEGRGALARLSWNEAYGHLRNADADSGLGASDLEGLGFAAWWSGRPLEATDYCERAFDAYLEADDLRGAARMAVWLGNVYMGRNSASVAASWLKQAERLIAKTGESPEAAWLTVTNAYIAILNGQPDRAFELAQQAREIAERVGAPDYASLALHVQGRIRVMQGDVDAGLAIIDEAIGPALAGRLEPFATGLLYCSTIGACKEIADYQRAAEWTRQAERWCEKLSVSGFPGICRVHRAEILRFGGEWTRAEQEARRACDELEGYFADAIAQGQYEIGEIRRRMGDLAGAEEAFRKSHEAGRDPQPGLALVRLAEGKTDAAFQAIKRSLSDESSTPPLIRLPLLPAAIEIAVTAGDLQYAEEAVAEIEGIAGNYRSIAMKASAAFSRGILELARGDADPAQHALRLAVRLWTQIANPYDAARTRVRLGEAYRAGGDEESAAMEFRAAHDAFQRLGAIRDARLAAQLLGTPVSGGTRDLRTFLFTDIVDSTRLLEAMGDEAWGHLLAWHDHTLRATFAAHGGREVKRMGDGFFVVFEEAGPAAAAAADIQKTLEAHRREHGFSPRVRIGLHSGEATLHDGDYQGRAIHEAARIGALAGGGEIVASKSTVEGLEGMRLSPPRPEMVKGFAEPIDVVTIEWR